MDPSSNAAGGSNLAKSTMDFGVQPKYESDILQHLQLVDGGLCMDYHINTFHNKEDADHVFQTLERNPHPLLPHILPPFQVSNDPRYYLAVQKLGMPLAQFLHRDINPKRKTPQRKEFKGNLLYEKRKFDNVDVALYLSPMYMKIVRDTVMVFRHLMRTDVRVDLDYNNINLLPDDTQTRVSFLKFQPRGSETDYKKECQQLIKLFRDINENSRIEEVPRREFESFFDTLENSTLEDHKYVYQHPIFWTEADRMDFIVGLFDFLDGETRGKGNAKIIYTNETKHAFGQDWDSSIRKCLSLRLLNKQYENYIIEKQLPIRRLTHGLSISAQTIPEDIEMKRRITCMRDMFVHFTRLTKDVDQASWSKDKEKTRALDLRSAENLQNLFQYVFPDHITTLVPQAIKLGMKIN